MSRRETDGSCLGLYRSETRKNVGSKESLVRKLREPARLSCLNALTTALLPEIGQLGLAGHMHIPSRIGYAGGTRGTWNLGVNVPFRSFLRIVPTYGSAMGRWSVVHDETGSGR